ncbi:MAG TPA: hypothetical protein VNB91_06010 [Jatrophihabitantaceae bacterium]|jgi:hypothetical protein|nr:hypothetical protein [Jatrophihabitantaceae bacterium]
MRRTGGTQRFDEQQVGRIAALGVPIRRDSLAPSIPTWCGA